MVQMERQVQQGQAAPQVRQVQKEVLAAPPAQQAHKVQLAHKVLPEFKVSQVQRVQSG
jgi:hypothetical protein